MWIPLSLILVSGVSLYLIIRRVDRALEKRGSGFSPPLRAIRNLLVPAAGLTSISHFALGDTLEQSRFKFLATLLGVVSVWVALTLLKALVVRRGKDSEKVPGLVLDLARFLLIVVGAALVVANVWEQDLSVFLTTLGVGSLVLGLALQDTLGSLFSGIAVMSEKTFSVGDWIKVNDKVGKVVGINWRSVRLRTRDHTILIIPNAALGKEVVENFTSPTKIAGTRLFVGFSYSDPPNKCKRILRQCATATQGVLSDPGPKLRTVEYGDFAINYEIRLFIDDYSRLLDIQEEFMTQVWYAARRHGLSIPFPIRTVYKTEIPPTQGQDRSEESISALRLVRLFQPLNADELKALSEDAIFQTYARDEVVCRQGDPGDSLYVVHQGSASVMISTATSQSRELAKLKRGDVFGEMGLLTGEARSATVCALEDLEVLVVYKEAVGSVMERRPELADDLAKLMDARRQGIEAVRAQDTGALANLKKASVRSDDVDLAVRIKRFLGL